MVACTRIGNLIVDESLARFMLDEVVPGTGQSMDFLWAAYEKLLDELEPESKLLLSERGTLQRSIDEWNRVRTGKPFNINAQRSFLEEIGYLVPEGNDFSIETTGVDPEISAIAGPQLVVPAMNARFALNAANARWGSLYDALYGTDAVPRTGILEPKGEYNEARGRLVVEHASRFLDTAIPLKDARHENVIRYVVAAKDGRKSLSAVLAGGARATLSRNEQFVGFTEGEAPSLLFRNHNLHIELRIDRSHPLGKAHPAGLRDIILESALTTIQDCEDSVAAVDASDKVAIYRNWLGLMRGDLSETFEKDGKTLTRKLASDKTFVGIDGRSISLPGRSLMLVRNVGHLMTTDAVCHADGSETPEGFLDAFVTTLCALHDLGSNRNSRHNSIYIVKPKMHGPKEAALTNTLFDRIEDMLNLPRHTIKVGVMDEERRTSVNLKETIRAVRGRLAFINTGFLDRTGDEIHTHMLAGPVVPKNEIKSTLWLGAYESNNMDIGLAAGLGGRAQIGKGMWAKPDAMAEMLEVKVVHPKGGASTAWVPSPTAATLHATHYHAVDVFTTQKSIMDRPKARLDDILTPPLLAGRTLSSDEVNRELNNNVQSILGYVVRWIDQGIGCSKVPDIDDVALMEDRATLRISAQHIANWLRHGVCSAEQVAETMKRMAVVVDRQNSNDPVYRPMASNFEASIAFQAARELVFEGLSQPNGYTEPVLHRRRREAKARYAN